MARTSAAAALLFVTCLTLAGCATSSASGPAESAPAQSAPALTDAPASGETITGTGYSFAVPQGWALPEDVPATGADVLAADLTDADGFADNVNVLLSPAGEVTPDQVETQGVVELESAGATDVTVGDRVTVAGSESAHLSAGLASSGVDYLIEQFYLSHEGQTYVVTFSFSPTVPDAEREALSGSVLASWAWG